MTAEERARVIVTGRMLRSATAVQWLTLGLTILAAAALIFTKRNRMAAVAALGLGAVSNFYSFRIALDARLFDDVINATLSTADLDAVFVKNAGRSWSDRCRGARRLLMICAAATAAQLLAVVFI